MCMAWQWYLCCLNQIYPQLENSSRVISEFLSFGQTVGPPCKSTDANKLLSSLWPLQVRDNSQEPCGRLSFLQETKLSKGIPQTAVCNLNITLPALKKVSGHHHVSPSSCHAILIHREETGLLSVGLK